MSAGTWVKLYVEVTEHPKCVGLSDAGWTMWVHGLAYAGRNLTDGAIPDGMIGRLCGTKNPRKAADELVAAGLWDRTPDGYRIHDYTELQRSADEVEAQRAASAKGGTKANHQRWHVNRGIVDPACQWCISGTDSDRTPEGIRKESETGHRVSVRGRGRERTTEARGNNSSSADCPIADDDPAVIQGREDYERAVARGAAITDPDAYLAKCVENRRVILAQPLLPADAPRLPRPHEDCPHGCDHGWLFPHGPDGGVLPCPGKVAS
jgi:hypothetical protein